MYGHNDLTLVSVCVCVCVTNASKGLYGGATHCSGGVDSDDCFSTRLMVEFFFYDCFFFFAMPCMKAGIIDSMICSPLVSNKWDWRTLPLCSQRSSSSFSLSNTASLGLQCGLWLFNRSRRMELQPRWMDECATGYLAQQR